MTDEQKTQLKEQAKKEDASPSYRHIGSTEREDTSTSDTVRSRGPSRSHPTFLGKIAIAANRANAFDHFSSPPWVHRLIRCTTHEDVIVTFRLYHSFCWSDRDDAPTDPVIKTDYTAQHKQYPIDYGEDNFSSD